MAHSFNIDGFIMHMEPCNREPLGKDFTKGIEVSKDHLFLPGPLSSGLKDMEQCGLVIIVLPMTMYHLL